MPFLLLFLLVYPLHFLLFKSLFLKEKYKNKRNLMLFFHKLIVPLYFHYFFHCSLFLILLQSLICSESVSFYTFFSLPYTTHQFLDLFCFTPTVALNMSTFKFPLAVAPGCKPEDFLAQFQDFPLISRATKAEGDS